MLSHNNPILLILCMLSCIMPAACQMLAQTLNLHRVPKSEGSPGRFLPRSCGPCMPSLSLHASHILLQDVSQTQARGRIMSAVPVQTCEGTGNSTQHRVLGKRTSFSRKTDLQSICGLVCIAWPKRVLIASCRPMKGQSQEQVAARCLRTLAALWARGSAAPQSSGTRASGTMRAPQTGCTHKHTSICQTIFGGFQNLPPTCSLAQVAGFLSQRSSWLVVEL